MNAEDVRKAVTNVRNYIEGPIDHTLLTIDVETVMEAAAMWLSEQDAKKEQP